MDTSKIISLLGDKSDYYLNHVCKTIDKSLLHLPSPTCVDDVWGNSDRNIQTLNSLQTLLGHGRLANTGYVSILPVDQDIERRVFLRSKPHLFRSGEYRKISDRGWLQRSRFYVRHTRVSRTKICS